MTIPPARSTEINFPSDNEGQTRRPLAYTDQTPDTLEAISLKRATGVALSAATSMEANGSRRSDELPIEAVSVSSLLAGLSPRSAGIEAAHVEQLMEAEWPLEPILVHRETRQIIDGSHRVAAARRRGIESIDAYFFDGPVEAAFILAVRANVKHGLPLTLTDRRAAARRILATHSEWSNRMIASSTGMSASAVEKLRCATDDDEQLHTRLGADGRRRPVSTASARRHAAEVLQERPGASLREVARVVGLSPGTVRDVRNRLSRGDSPLPGATSSAATRGGTHFAPSLNGSDYPLKPTPRGQTVEIDAVLSVLARNPSIRMSQGGRELLRWLHQRSVRAADAERVTQTPVPDHCVPHVIEIARRCSANWARIADELEAQERDTRAEQPDKLARRATG